MKKYVFILALLLVVTGMIGCKKPVINEGESPVPEIISPEIIDDSAPEYRLSNEEMVEILNGDSKGINALNASLIDMASISGNESVMVSGFSAYSCLSPVAKYTAGDTKAQIENALGEMHPDALEYFKTNMPIETGTLFLIDDDTILNAKSTNDFVFKDLQSDGIVDYVNGFVSEKTHNLITDIISAPFPELCRAAVVDTLYFKGTWEHEFMKDLTDKQIFHGLNNDVETDFMHTVHKYGVNTEDNIIQLRYRNSDLVMDICYDTNDRTPNSVFDDYISKLDGLDDSLDYSYDVNLSMPKFTVESDLNVTKAYENLGMTNMFDPAYTDDFKALADDVYVSQVVQKTKIIVDEEGTEAAAVTMMTMDAACAMTEPKILDITIDKPFVYAIRDTKTDIILFAGYVNDF